MTRKTPEPPAAASATPKPQPLPRTGGAYVVLDGVLSRDPADLPDAAQPTLTEV